MRRKAGIWLRVSTDDQAEGDSLKHHEYRAKAYAEAKGWEIVEIYRLEGVSGSDSLNSPDGQRMISDVRSGRIDVLIFSKLARLARNTRHLLEVADVFKKHGADLVSLQESIDTSSPAGRLFYTILAAFAEWEREEISSRIAASVPIRAKLGKSTGGPPPYGYKWVDARLEINEPEADVRRLIYSLFLEHKKYITVANILNERGIESREQVGWSDAMIKRVIVDPVAIGRRVVNFTGKSEDQWIEQDAPAIIDNETYQACLQIVDGKVRRGRAPRHLFAGLVHCACGKKIYTDHVSKSYRCRNRECKTVIKSAELERAFENRLADLFSSGDTVSLFDEQIEREIDSKQKELDFRQRDLERLERERKQILQAFINGHLLESEFGQYSSEYTGKIEAVKKDLSGIEGKLAFLRNQSESRAETIVQASEVLKHWRLFTDDEKRELAEKLIVKITVGPEFVEFVIGYTLNKEKSNESQDPFDYSVLTRGVNIDIKTPRQLKSKPRKRTVIV